MIKQCTLIEALYCKEHDSVVEVAKKLREHVIRYVYVVDKTMKPIGVISTTDVNNRVVAEGKNPANMVAKDIMTTPVCAFDMHDPARTAYEACVKNKVSTCAVTENGKLKGIVTIYELLRKITDVE